MDQVLSQTEDPNQIIHPGQALAGPRSLALGPDRKGKPRYSKFSKVRTYDYERLSIFNQGPKRKM